MVPFGRAARHESPAQLEADFSVESFYSFVFWLTNYDAGLPNVFTKFDYPDRARIRPVGCNVARGEMSFCVGDDTQPTIELTRQPNGWYLLTVFSDRAETLLRRIAQYDINLMQTQAVRFRCYKWAIYRDPASESSSA